MNRKQYTRVHAMNRTPYTRVHAMNRKLDTHGFMTLYHSEFGSPSVWCNLCLRNSSIVGASNGLRAFFDGGCRRGSGFGPTDFALDAVVGCQSELVAVDAD